VSLRGTLSNATRNLETALAQFPGQSPASLYLTQQRYIGALHSVLRPNLINVFNYGLRGKVRAIRRAGDQFHSQCPDPLYNYTARGRSRILPVSNLVDDLTWTKGKHTVTTGINFRMMQNDRLSYAQSFPSLASAPTLQLASARHSERCHQIHPAA